MAIAYSKIIIQLNGSWTILLPNARNNNLATLIQIGLKTIPILHGMHQNLTQVKTLTFFLKYLTNA